MQSVLLKCTFVLLACIQVQCAQILGIFHVPSYSHYSLGRTLMEELAERGHAVTMISPYSSNTSLNEIKLEGYAEKLKVPTRSCYERTEINSFSEEIFINAYALEMTETFFSQPEVEALLSSNQKFDLVILEEFMTYALKGIAHHFKTPCIMFSALGYSRWINPQVGNPTIPSFMADPTLPYTSKMNFIQRAHNFVQLLFSEVYRNYWILPRHDGILHQFLPGVASDVWELYYNVSLVLVNSDLSTHEAVAYVPNMIDVGGFHVEKMMGELPGDLKKYLDEARDGFVYFSMGSILKSAEMSVEKVGGILRSFGRLKAKVLWKWEEEQVLDGVPENVLVRKWLPQVDVLAHPNIKLFITHGGLLSSIEAIHFGVPILGIPIYGDQKRNLAYAIQKGFGLKIPYTELTEESFFESLQEILNNPKYRTSAKFYAKIMQDRLVKPLDKAVYWIEYVLRYSGAIHLRNAGVDLYWYQYYLLDVIAAVIAAILLIVASILSVLKSFGSARKLKRD